MNKKIIGLSIIGFAILLSLLWISFFANPEIQSTLGNFTIVVDCNTEWTGLILIDEGESIYEISGSARREWTYTCEESLTVEVSKVDIGERPSMYSGSEWVMVTIWRAGGGGMVIQESIGESEDRILSLTVNSSD